MLKAIYRYAEAQAGLLSTVKGDLSAKHNLPRRWSNFSNWWNDIPT
jgi:hypothetical protein